MIQKILTTLIVAYAVYFCLCKLCSFLKNHSKPDCGCNCGKTCDFYNRNCDSYPRNCCKEEHENKEKQAQKTLERIRNNSIDCSELKKGDKVTIRVTGTKLKHLQIKDFDGQELEVVSRDAFKTTLRNDYGAELCVDNDDDGVLFCRK